MCVYSVCVHVCVFCCWRLLRVYVYKHTHTFCVTSVKAVPGCTPSTLMRPVLRVAHYVLGNKHTHTQKRGEQAGTYTHRHTDTHSVHLKYVPVRPMRCTWFSMFCVCVCKSIGETHTHLHTGTNTHTHAHAHAHTHSTQAGSSACLSHTHTDTHIQHARTHTHTH